MVLIMALLMVFATPISAFANNWLHAPDWPRWENTVATWNPVIVKWMDFGNTWTNNLEDMDYEVYLYKLVDGNDVQVGKKEAFTVFYNGDQPDRPVAVSYFQTLFENNLLNSGVPVRFKVRVKFHQNSAGIENNWQESTSPYAEFYEVTFDDGVSGAVNRSMEIKGSTIKRPEDPKAKGKIFNGWYDSEGKLWDFKTDTVQHSMTLSARWSDLNEHDHDGMHFEEWHEQNRLPDSAGNYFLVYDVELPAAWNVPDGTVNLCLNGHTIKCSNNADGLYLHSNSTLNLYDEKTEDGFNGKITGIGNDSWAQPAAVVVDGGTFNMYGGRITGNRNKGNYEEYYQVGKGCGVTVKSGGHFTLDGGEISDNQRNVFWSYGGAVNVEGASSEMTILSGKICNNRTESYGAGIYLDEAATLYMYGGEISGNYSNNASGIYIKNNARLVLGGGTITANRADNKGAGVYLGSYGILKLVDSPDTRRNSAFIANNLVNGAENNVFLNWGKIDISELTSFDESAAIGVTTANNPGPGSPAQLTQSDEISDKLNDLDLRIFSDSDKYCTYQDRGEPLYLYRQWKAQIDLNGGEGNLPTEPFYIPDGMEIDMPKCSVYDIHRYCWSFGGWKVGSEEFGEGDSYKVSSDFTLQAQWVTECMDGHSPKEPVRENEVPATCTQEGSYEEVVSCDICKAELSRKTVTEPMTEHNWGAWEETKPATETETGTETRTCSACSKTETRTIPVTTHKHVCSHVEEESATCTEDGRTEYWQCDKGDNPCGRYFADEEGKVEIDRARTISKATGHTPGEWSNKENLVDATCTEDGHYDMVRRCTKCEEMVESFTADIPATGHTLVMTTENEVPATCAQEGSYEEVVSCKICKAELSRKTVSVPMTDHNWSPWEPAAEPETAMETRTCGNCGTTETRSTLPAGHTHTLTHVEAEAATCTEDGRTEYWQCDEGDNPCGRYFADEEGKVEIDRARTISKATGHTPGEQSEVKRFNATCTEDGSSEMAIFCSDCGMIITKVSTVLQPAKGHNYQEIEGSAKAATCTEAGKEADKKCSRCEYVVAGAEIPALGHKFGAWKVTKKATVKASGQYTRICANDANHKETKAIAKNNMTAKPKSKMLSAKAKKKTTIRASKAFKVTNAKGKLSYKKTSGNKKITVSKSGKITVKKGLKKGKTYKVKVKITSAATAEYAAVTKIVTLKIKAK